MKQRIIIAFDGPDNVGKGTQLKLLRKKYSEIPFLILNVDTPCGSSDTEKIYYGIEHTNRTLKTAQLLPYSQIHDRFHFSEYAYSFFRGGHNLQTILEIEKECVELKNDLIIFTFIDEVENISNRDDGLSQYEKGEFEKIHTLVERFKEINEHSIFDAVLINIQGKDIETVHAEVIKNIEEKFPFLKK